jgi:hypothetical protein
MYRRLAGELGLAKGAEPSIPFGEQHVGVVEPRVTVTVDTPLPTRSSPDGLPTSDAVPAS